MEESKRERSQGEESRIDDVGEDLEYERSRESERNALAKGREFWM